METNNKLIADFMGLDIISLEQFLVGTQSTIDRIKIGRKDFICPMIEGYLLEQLQYHKSWDWLMKVVDKIESLGIVSFEKNLQEEGDYQCLFTKGYDILICHYADTSIEATYNAVIQFINYYNKK